MIKRRTLKTNSIFLGIRTFHETIAVGDLMLFAMWGNRMFPFANIIVINTTMCLYDAVQNTMILHIVPT